MVTLTNKQMSNINGGNFGFNGPAYFDAEIPSCYDPGETAIAAGAGALAGGPAGAGIAGLANFALQLYQADK